MILHEDKTFDNIDYADKDVSNREFVKCLFHACNFSNSNISGNEFVECQFIDCNLSLTKFGTASLKTVFFKNCKLIVSFYFPGMAIIKIQRAKIMSSLSEN